MRRLMIIMLCLPFVFITHAQTDSPPPRPIITPENAHQLTQIAQLGRGSILDVAFSEDESTLLVASTIGIWAYDMTDLSAEPMLIVSYQSRNGSFSPNAQLFISINPHTLTIWDISQNRIIARMNNGLQARQRYRYAFSPDSRQIAIYADSKIHIFDIEMNQLRLRLPLPSRLDDVLHIIWHPDSTKIAIHNRVSSDEQFTYNEEFWIWDIATGQVVNHIIFPHLNNYSPQTADIQFSPDGQVLLLGTQDKMRLWSVMNRVEVQTIFERFMSASRVLFSPDGRMIASSGGQARHDSYAFTNTSIYLWDVEREETLAWMHGHLHFVVKMIFSPDSRRLASLDSEGVIRIWDVHLGEQIGIIRDHDNRGQLYGNSDSSLFISESSDNALYVWDADTFTPHLIPDLAESPSPLYPIGFSPDGNTFIAHNWFHNELLAIDTTSWQVRHTVPAFELREVKFHGTLPIIGFRSQNTYTHFWDYETGIAGFDGFEGLLYYFEFLSQTRQMLYNETQWYRTRQRISAPIPYLVLMDTDTSETIDVVPSARYVAGISPDESIMVTAHPYNYLWVWDTATWSIRYVLEGVYHDITSDSNYIIISRYGDRESRLIFIDSETGVPSHEIVITSDMPYYPNLQFSPNYDWVAYISDKSEFVLMDTQTSTILKSFSVAHLKSIDRFTDRNIPPTLQISPDGRFIFIVGEVTQILGIPTENVP